MALYLCPTGRLHSSSRGGGGRWAGQGQDAYQEQSEYRHPFKRTFLPHLLLKFFFTSPQRVMHDDCLMFFLFAASSMYIVLRAKGQA